MFSRICLFQRLFSLSLLFGRIIFFFVLLLFQFSCPALLWLFSPSLDLFFPPEDLLFLFSRISSFFRFRGVLQVTPPPPRPVAGQSSHIVSLPFFDDHFRRHQHWPASRAQREVSHHVLHSPQVVFLSVFLLGLPNQFPSDTTPSRCLPFFFLLNKGLPPCEKHKFSCPPRFRGRVYLLFRIFTVSLVGLDYWISIILLTGPSVFPFAQVSALEPGFRRPSLFSMKVLKGVSRTHPPLF